MLPLRLLALCLVLVLVPSLPLHRPMAQPSSETADQSDAEDASPNVLSSAAMLLPGLVLHGAGHYVTGHKTTAYSLFKWQLAGLGMMVASGLSLRLLGGSRYGNELTIPTFVIGSGIFFNTFLADVFGTLTGGTDFGHERPRPHKVALGYAYIADPLFPYAHFNVTSAELRWHDLAFKPTLWFALGADNQRLRLPLHYRWKLRELGEQLQLTAASTYHNYGNSGFTTYTGELSSGIRLHLSRLGNSLRGGFSRFRVGLGLHQVRYTELSETDTQALLLARFGFGFYLPRSGEIEAYYQHRRDDFTSGASPGSRNGSGFLGHFGLRLHQPINDRFALLLRSEIGSAWLTSLQLEVAFGARP